jgi:D-alanyl-D-alanine carboxypeptidase
VVGVLALLVTACGDDGGSGRASAPPTTTPRVDPALADDLDAALAHELERNPLVPGEILLVRAPGFEHLTAQGRDGLGGPPLTPDRTIRVASVTKTFTAAATLRLVEEGGLSLDQPVAPLLPVGFRTALASDGYDLETMTVRLLLRHRAGLYDYATDEDYVTLGLTDPNHRWSALEQIRFAVDHGDPVAPPGETRLYSDTAYVLLGQIVEHVTGEPMAEAYRRLLDLDGLGLEHTWLERLEPEPAGVEPRVRRMFGELDASALDPSFDLYGGGGYVSTASDIATFYEALFGGEVFDDPETLATMEDEEMGLFRVNAAGETCYEHTGFWGTVAFHCPDAGITIVRHIGQALDAVDGTEPFLADLNILTVSRLQHV